MERTFAAFSYTCPSCGWVGYKTEKYEGVYCAKCGCQDEPKVELTTQTVTIVDELQQELDKAAEFGKKLREAEDPDKVIEEMINNASRKASSDMFRCSLAGLFFYSSLSGISNSKNY